MMPPHVISRQGHYFSFLVRLWCESPQTDWRASAENIPSGETYAFASLELLFDFLQRRTALRPAVTGAPPPDPPG